MGTVRSVICTGAVLFYIQFEGQACLDAVMDEAVPNDRAALLAYAAENLQRFANS